MGSSPSSFRFRICSARWKKLVARHVPATVPLYLKVLITVRPQGTIDRRVLEAAFGDYLYLVTYEVRTMRPFSASLMSAALSRSSYSARLLSKSAIAESYAE